MLSFKLIKFASIPTSLQAFIFALTYILLAECLPTKTIVKEGLLSPEETKKSISFLISSFISPETFIPSINLFINF